MFLFIINNKEVFLIKNRPTRQDKPKAIGGTMADNHLSLFQSLFM